MVPVSLYVAPAPQFHYCLVSVLLSDQISWFLINYYKVHKKQLWRKNDVMRINTWWASHDLNIMVIEFPSFHLLNHILDIPETIDNSKFQQYLSILFQCYLTKIWVPTKQKNEYVSTEQPYKKMRA
jgi:hypothetical protein